MSRPLRTLLVLCVAALVVAGLAAQPAMAKEKEACWRTLINDWYDGVIDDTYKLSCYRDALDHLGADLTSYSSAREDINRAYQARIAEIRKSRNQAKNPQKPGGPDENQQEIPVVTPPATPPPPDPGNEVATPTPPTPPVTDPPTPPTKNEKPAPQVTETGPKLVPLPSRDPQPSTQPGRQNPDGPIPSAIAKLGPDDADSLPIPLLVLGGLALVLMLGGVLGFVARRVQSRRPPMRPATAPAETRRR